MSEVFYSPSALAVLKMQLESISPETWHKMMHPLCTVCAFERGLIVLRERENPDALDS